MSGPGASRFETVKKSARIEIIPLIDVIFFLLATFVLFTLSLEKIGGLEAQLPDTPPPDRLVPPDDLLFVQASAADSYYWKVGPDAAPELVTAAELPARLAQYRASVPRPRVMIRGDSQASLGAAVRVLDAVREAKISEVSIETLPGATGK